MAEIEVSGLTSVGLITDVEPEQLPVEAWTTALNVIYKDAGVESIPDDREILENPSITPIFLMQTRSAAQRWYIYASQTAVMAHDGSTEYDITGPTTPAAAVPNDWHGTLIGGIPILTDGVNPLQYWASYDGGVTLANLPNWGATWSAKVVRSMGPFVITFNVVKDGISYPHMIKWATGALPGEVPASWDETDPEFDAGENDLSDVEAGIILDALPMRGQMYIYKETSTHVMRYIGGREIFSFDGLFETTGILAPHCVAVVNKSRWQLVMTQDDLMFHDGITPVSVLDKRLRRNLIAAIDSDNYSNSFVVDWPAMNAALFAYPENGAEFPTRGILWHYGESGSCSEIEVDFHAATLLDLDEASDISWDSETETDWDTPIDIWNRTNRRQLAVVKPTLAKMYQFAGSSMSTRGWTLQRLACGFNGEMDGKSRPIVNFHQWKMLRRIWVKGTAAFGMNVRAGSQLEPSGPVTWSPTGSFVSGVGQNWVDMIATGPALAYEFSGGGDARLVSYKPEFELLGEF